MQKNKQKLCQGKIVHLFIRGKYQKPRLFFLEVTEVGNFYHDLVESSQSQSQSQSQNIYLYTTYMYI